MFAISRGLFSPPPARYRFIYAMLLTLADFHFCCAHVERKSGAARSSAAGAAIRAP